MKTLIILLIGLWSVSVSAQTNNLAAFKQSAAKSKQMLARPQTFTKPQKFGSDQEAAKIIMDGAVSSEEAERLKHGEFPTAVMYRGAMKAWANGDKQAAAEKLKAKQDIESGKRAKDLKEKLAKQKAEKKTELQNVETTTTNAATTAKEKTK